MSKRASSSSPGGLVVFRGVLASVVVVGGLVLPGSPAAAAEGDWLLTASTESVCVYDFEDPAWCGPELSVQVPYLLTSDDLYSATFTITGPSGPVATKSSRAFYRETPRPSRFTTSTPTGLPAGTYRVSFDLSVSGRWSCSVYNPSGCSWRGGISASYDYDVPWGGAPVTVQPTWQLRAKVTDRQCVKTCVVEVTARTNIPEFTYQGRLERKAGKKWVKASKWEDMYDDNLMFARKQPKGKNKYRIVVRTNPVTVSNVVTSGKD